MEGRRGRELEAGLSDRAGFPQGEIYKRGNLDRKEGGRSWTGSRGREMRGERETIRRKGRERDKLLTPDAV